MLFLRCISIVCMWAVWSAPVRSACNRCEAGVNAVAACHSETVYSFCINGMPSSYRFSCPAGTVCSGSDRACTPKSEGAASCPSPGLVPEQRTSQCGRCTSADRVFACLNATTVAFCFGGETPDYTATMTCPPDTVCDLGNYAYCSDGELAQPSCWDERLEVDGVLPTTVFASSPTPRPSNSAAITTATAVQTTQTPPFRPVTTTRSDFSSSSLATTSQVATTVEPSPEKTTTRAPVQRTKAPPPTTTREGSKGTTASIRFATKTTPYGRGSTSSGAASSRLATTKSAATTIVPSVTSKTGAPPCPDSTASAVSANVFCAEKQKSGLYTVLDDMTCTTFYVCYTLDDVHYEGELDVCPSGQYFEQDLQVCIDQRPATCANCESD